MDQIRGFQQEKKVFFRVQKFTVGLIERGEERELNLLILKKFCVCNMSSGVHLAHQTDPQLGRLQ